MITKPRILLYGDFLPTGFGRIVQAVARHLNNLDKYDLMGACVQWDGILPLPQLQPFHVCALNGRDQGQGAAGLAHVVANIVGAAHPDIIISVQDFPYHDALRAAPIDWSVIGHIVITPIDGAPVDHRWATISHEFDALLTISEFGVRTLHEAGVKADLCAPGVDMDEFHRLPDAERLALRDKLNLPHDAFVVGVMAMNQGRKDFPSMIAGFAEAFRAEPNTYLYLDCTEVSPVGWDIPNMILKHVGLDPARVRYRTDAFKAGVGGLNERYNLLDLHMVIAHREGYGLPHGEAMATGCPSIALDWCSGREVIGENKRGWLIPAAAPHPHSYGTWGGALDYWPNMEALVAALREAYASPTERVLRGMQAVQWIKQHRTWQRAGVAVERAVERVIAKRGHDFAQKRLPVPPPMPNNGMPPALNVNGVQYVIAGANGHGQKVGT